MSYFALEDRLFVRINSSDARRGILIAECYHHIGGGLWCDILDADDVLQDFDILVCELGRLLRIPARLIVSSKMEGARNHLYQVQVEGTELR